MFGLGFKSRLVAQRNGIAKAEREAEERSRRFPHAEIQEFTRRNRAILRRSADQLRRSNAAKLEAVKEVAAVSTAAVEESAAATQELLVEEEAVEAIEALESEAAASEVVVVSEAKADVFVVETAAAVEVAEGLKAEEVVVLENIETVVAEEVEVEPITLEEAEVTAVILNECVVATQKDPELSSIEEEEVELAKEEEVEVMECVEAVVAEVAEAQPTMLEDAEVAAVSLHQGVVAKQEDPVVFSIDELDLEPLMLKPAPLAEELDFSIGDEVEEVVVPAVKRKSVIHRFAKSMRSAFGRARRALMSRARNA